MSPQLRSIRDESSRRERYVNQPEGLNHQCVSTSTHASSTGCEHCFKRVRIPLSLTKSFQGCCAEQHLEQRAHEIGNAKNRSCAAVRVHWKIAFKPGAFSAPATFQ